MEDGRLPELRVQGEACKKALQGIRPPGGKVRPEAVAANIFHPLLVRERGDGGSGEGSVKRLVEEEEVGEAPADGNGWFLEGGERCLLLLAFGLPIGRGSDGMKTYVCSDHIRDVGILSPVILLMRF